MEANGQEVAAIPHAQAAGDWAHAARLLAENRVDLVFHGRKATLRARLAAFPAGAAEADAELALALATARVYDGQLEECAADVALAERLAGTVSVERRRSSTSDWPARGCGSPASAAICPPHARRSDRSTREPRMRWRAGTTTARRP